MRSPIRRLMTFRAVAMLCKYQAVETDASGNGYLVKADCHFGPGTYVINPSKKTTTHEYPACKPSNCPIWEAME
jgi:hypothetical protein